MTGDAEDLMPTDGPAVLDFEPRLVIVITPIDQPEMSAPGLAGGMVRISGPGWWQARTDMQVASGPMEIISESRSIPEVLEAMAASIRSQALDDQANRVRSMPPPE